MSFSLSDFIPDCLGFQLTEIKVILLKFVLMKSHLLISTVLHGAPCCFAVEQAASPFEWIVLSNGLLHLFM